MARSHLETINARYRSAANSGTLKPRGVFNAKDNQFIKEIKGFYKKLKKRVKAHSDKVDGRESPVGDSPDEQDQISEGTADKEDETVIRDGFIDPSPTRYDYQRQRAREYFNDLMARGSPDAQSIIGVARDMLQPGSERPAPPPSQSTLNFDPVRMVETLRHLHLPNSVRLVDEMISSKCPAAAAQHTRSGAPNKTIAPANSRPAIFGFSWQSQFLEMDSLPGEPSQMVNVPNHHAEGQPEQQQRRGHRK
ncbi:hypothetical protein CKAH01_18530 [Colletotrichum kahawae]|uniref:Uncharacterized protein n=1 Tax=Colletotrichum kahawae TaxID=34407 RepID=A0AAE0D297_COLKA|nr:hypothetical protein CKAH01_18530 [Colletotrichum kahawae]